MAPLREAAVSLRIAWEAAAISGGVGKRSEGAGRRGGCGVLTERNQIRGSGCGLLRLRGVGSGRGPGFGLREQGFLGFFDGTKPIFEEVDLLGLRGGVFAGHGPAPHILGGMVDLCGFMRLVAVCFAAGISLDSSVAGVFAAGGRRWSLSAGNGPKRPKNKVQSAVTGFPGDRRIGRRVLVPFPTPRMHCDSGAICVSGSAAADFQEVAK
jgi:hypothetical protein